MIDLDSRIACCRMELRGEMRTAMRLAEDLRSRLTKASKAPAVLERGVSLHGELQLAFALHGATSRVLRQAALLDGLITASETTHEKRESPAHKAQDVCPNAIPPSR